MHEIQDRASPSVAGATEAGDVSSGQDLKVAICQVEEPGAPSVALPSETLAKRRRRERIALIEEFGGHEANIKQAALEAINRGMYSPRTSRGDVELCLMRTWMLRKRSYGR
jgi:hypothetical protein